MNMHLLNQTNFSCFAALTSTNKRQLTKKYGSLFLMESWASLVSCWWGDVAISGHADATWPWASQGMHAHSEADMLVGMAVPSRGKS